MGIGHVTVSETITSDYVEILVGHGEDITTSSIVTAPAEHSISLHLEVVHTATAIPDRQAVVIEQHGIGRAIQSIFEKEVSGRWVIVGSDHRDGKIRRNRHAIGLESRPLAGTLNSCRGDVER